MLVVEVPVLLATTFKMESTVSVANLSLKPPEVAPLSSFQLAPLS